MPTIAAIAAILIVFLIILAVSSIKIVQPFQRGVKERLGKYRETLDPGLRTIVPFVDKIRLVDMREQVVDVPPQEVITSDNVVVSVDAVVYYEPTDPQRLVYNVADFFTAILLITAMPSRIVAMSSIRTSKLLPAMRNTPESDQKGNLPRGLYSSPELRLSATGADRSAGAGYSL